MSDRSELKRKYPSGASKRKKKTDDTKNTSRISSHFSGDIRTGYSSHEEANGSEIDNQSELPSTSQDGNNHDLEEVFADILEGNLMIRLKI